MPALFRALHFCIDNAVCTLFGPAAVKLPRGFHASKVLDSVASSMSFLSVGEISTESSSTRRISKCLSPILSKGRLYFEKTECSSQAWVFHIQVNKVGGVPARNKRPRLRGQCPSRMWQDSELQTVHSTWIQCTAVVAVHRRLSLAVPDRTENRRLCVIHGQMMWKDKARFMPCRCDMLMQGLIGVSRGNHTA